MTICSSWFCHASHNTFPTEASCHPILLLKAAACIPWAVTCSQAVCWMVHFFSHSCNRGAVLFTNSPTDGPPCVLLLHCSGFACPERTGVLSYMVHGCKTATVYCPAGSSEPAATPAGFYAVANDLGLYFDAVVCEAGRWVGPLVGDVWSLCDLWAPAFQAPGTISLAHAFPLSRLQLLYRWYSKILSLGSLRRPPWWHRAGMLGPLLGRLLLWTEVHKLHASSLRVKCSALLPRGTVQVSTAPST